MECRRKTEVERQSEAIPGDRYRFPAPPAGSSPLPSRVMRAPFQLLLASASSMLVFVGCGPSMPPPASPAAKVVAAQAPSAPEPTPEQAHELPTQCAPSTHSKLCVPPSAFVQRLCGGSFPTAILHLFRQGSPWTRGYVTRTLEAWNASGGAASNEKLALDEEVLVVVHRVPAPGGMVVSGASGGYDVLRWDGSCATLMAEELTLRRPSSPKAAKVVWRTIEDAAQEAMLADPKVSTAVSERRKECKGASMGDVSLKCEKADQKLSRVLVDYVRQGGALPAAKKLP